MLTYITILVRFKAKTFSVLISIGIKVKVITNLQIFVYLSFNSINPNRHFVEKMSVIIR